MGTLIMTPNYTNLFIHLLEQHFIHNYPTHSKTWKNKVEFHRWLLYPWNINRTWIIWTWTFTCIACPHCVIFFLFSIFQRKITFSISVCKRNTLSFLVEIFQMWTIFGKRNPKLPTFPSFLKFSQSSCWKLQNHKAFRLEKTFKII